MHSKSLTCWIRSGGHHERRLVRMAADMRDPIDQGRVMSRQWVVLAAKLDPQAVCYFMRDRQAGAAVDLNGIANIGIVHEGFRLIRTEDASRRAALTTRPRSLTQARIGGSISQRSGITGSTALVGQSSLRTQLMF